MCLLKPAMKMSLGLHNSQIHKTVVELDNKPPPRFILMKEMS